MVDFGKSEKMKKISEKVHKPTLTMDPGMIFRSLFKKEILKKENEFFN